MSLSEVNAGNGPTSGMPVRVALRGEALLSNPRLNKGTAFSAAERQTFGLEGLLPEHVSTIEQQLQRVYAAIMRKDDPLERFIGLAALQARNETLFHRVLCTHIEEFLPIVYTPTVGLACQHYSHIFRQPRGVWITPRHRGRIGQVLANAARAQVRLLVVTDNERILGLGDQGAGGIGISIGKANLYTLAAGIHPDQILPVSLDVGTDNPALLADDLYLGWRQPRLRGAEYDALVEEFVTAVMQQFPGALLQWEDFKQQNAFTLLERYRARLPSFNDDIQGTSAIGAAATLAAGRATGTPLVEQRIIIAGAGAAGIGIARHLRDLLLRQGRSMAEIQRQIIVTDSGGFLHDGRTLALANKREFAWPVAAARAAGLPVEHPEDLTGVIRAFRPTVLIGTTGQAGLFSEQAVRTMAAHVARPTVLPLSNPDSKAEARPADVLAWTDGRAIVATGSPFPPVPWQGQSRRIGQANNVFIFPGVGLGAIVAQARRISDGMFIAAGETLAAQVSSAQLADGVLFPPLCNLREITARVAEAVVRQVLAEGLGTPIAEAAIGPAIRAAMWLPAYREYVPA